MKQPLRAVEVRRFLREQGVADLSCRTAWKAWMRFRSRRSAKLIRNSCACGLLNAPGAEEQRMAIPKLTAYALPTAAELPTNKVNWAFEPERAALLIHDMQEYFLNFWGENSDMMQQVVANIAKLRAYCKEHNIPVYYTAQPKEQSDEDRALLNDMWGRG